MKEMLTDAMKAVLKRMNTRAGNMALYDLRSMASQIKKTGAKDEAQAVIRALDNFEKAEMVLVLAIGELAAKITFDGGVK